MVGAKGATMAFGTTGGRELDSPVALRTRLYILSRKVSIAAMASLRSVSSSGVMATPTKSRRRLKVVENLGRDSSMASWSSVNAMEAGVPPFSRNRIVLLARLMTELVVMSEISFCREACWNPVLNVEDILMLNEIVES